VQRARQRQCNPRCLEALICWANHHQQQQAAQQAQAALELALAELQQDRSHQRWCSSNRHLGGELLPFHYYSEAPVGFEQKGSTCVCFACGAEIVFPTCQAAEDYSADRSEYLDRFQPEHVWKAVNYGFSLNFPVEAWRKWDQARKAAASAKGLVGVLAGNLRYTAGTYPEQFNVNATVLETVLHFAQ
jgi:hypothetical protein